MAERLSLNETELLLLQQRMEGDVSGVGYSLEIAGIETADYRGQEGGNIFETHPVQATDQVGWINRIQFYVTDPNTPEDRTVLLHIYRDGHIRCEKHVVPELVNDIVGEISTIKGYRDYLTPLNELIGRFGQPYFQGETSYHESRFIRNVNEQFEHLIEEFFDTNQFREKEGRMYISIIANIGVELCKDGVPSSEDYTDVPELDGESFQVEDDNLEGFFSLYSYYVNDEDEIDYSELTNHLQYLLEQSWDNPLEVIRHAIDTYDLSN